MHTKNEPQKRKRLGYRWRRSSIWGNFEEKTIDIHLSRKFWTHFPEKLELN